MAGGAVADQPRDELVALGREAARRDAHRQRDARRWLTHLRAPSAVKSLSADLNLNVLEGTYEYSCY
jgi:hypothetical protein